MKLKHVFILSLLCFSQISYAQIRAAGGREAKQKGRIKQGIKSGSLTKKELKALKREQGQIKKAEEEYMSDGEMSVKEKIKLQGKRNKASKHIYKAKHNKHSRN